MKRKQLIVLIVYTLGMYVMGNMAITLLPVYAAQLGMTESAIGIYFGIAFTFTTIGAFFGGWLSNRFQRRKLTIIIVSIIGIPATFLMGQVKDIGLLTVFTLIVWFVVGIAVAMLNILIGIYAEPNQRGRIFGIIATMIALGTVIGSFLSGSIAQRWGYTTLFVAAALAWVVPLIAALFIQDDKRIRMPKGQPKPASVPLGRPVWLMILATIFASISGNIAGLARPLTMNELGFDPNLISSAASISGLVGLPLPFLVGWLSDRTGRKKLLIASYVIVCLGMLALIGAVNLWQFWLSASLMALAGAAGGVASALLTDLAPPEAQGTALARFSATPWIAAIIGFGATGVITQTLGLTVTLLIGAVLPVFAILILVNVRKGARPAPALDVLQGVPQEDESAA